MVPEQVRADFDFVRQVLSTAVGEERAVTIGELTARAPWKDRRHTEQIIELYLLEFPWPLVSSSAGVFIPTKAEDLNHYFNSLESRIRKLWWRKKRVRLKACARGFKRDGKVFVDPPAPQGELNLQLNLEIPNA